jgi:hypothetical protein
MKITSRREPAPPPAFTPVSVTFTFDTQEELNSMGTLFNFAPFTDALRKLSGSSVDAYYISFQQVGGKIAPVSVWRDEINKMCSKKHIY